MVAFCQSVLLKRVDDDDDDDDDDDFPRTRASNRDIPFKNVILLLLARIV